MFRSTTKMTALLLLVTHARADYWWANSCGPGTPEDRAAGKAGSTGEPYQGYHIATRDPSQSWDKMIVCKDGQERKNQYIAEDAKPNTAAINIDPADGVYGTGTKPFRNPNFNYDYDKTAKLFTIPDGKANKGYPVTPLADSYVTVLRKAGADLKDSNGGPDGLVLSGTADGYNKIAEDKDYMLLVFGAKWCAACADFMPRFEQYYNKLKQTNNKFEAVYFSNANNEQEFQSESYGFPTAPFDQELADKLEFTLKKKQIPCVIVVNRAGETLTTDGVRAIKGLMHIGNFPADLADGAEFFTDAPILPNDGECDVDADEQRRALKLRSDQEVEGMNYDALVAEAAKVAHGADVPSGEAPLREFVRNKMREAVDNASDAKVQELYAAEQQAASDPSQYKFQVGDHVRVKKAFSSDPERPGSAASPIKLLDGQGRPNVGRVNRVGSASSGAQGAAAVEGAIQVLFADNQFAQRWILPEHFDNIEKIPASEA